MAEGRRKNMLSIQCHFSAQLFTAKVKCHNTHVYSGISRSFQVTLAGILLLILRKMHLKML